MNKDMLREGLDQQIDETVHYLAKKCKIKKIPEKKKKIETFDEAVTHLEEKGTAIIGAKEDLERIWEKEKGIKMFGKYIVRKGEVVIESAKEKIVCPVFEKSDLERLKMMIYIKNRL